MKFPKSVALIVLFATGGAAVGAGLGSRAETEYEATTNVAIAQVLVFPSWESNSQTARMAHTLRQSNTQTQAAANTGLSGGFGRVSAVTSDGSSIVTISAVLKTEDATTPMNELVDLALDQLVQDDLLYANQTLAANQGRLNEVEEELRLIYDQVDLAPNTNLGDVFNSAKFGLESAETQLAAATDDYWLTRLPGDIRASRSRLDAIGPVLRQWIDLSQELRILEDRVQAPREIIAKLGVGESLLDSGEHHRAVDVQAISTKAVLARFVAGGAAVGLGIGLVLTAGVTSTSAPRTRARATS